MLKLTYCVRKRSDMPAAEFHDYWLTKHGPLVRSVKEAMGASRYVQSHTILPETNAMLQASRGAAPAYDGITEVWWESREAFDRGTATEAGRAAALTLLEDERKFIDFAGSSLFMTEEHEIF